MTFRATKGIVTGPRQGGQAKGGPCGGGWHADSWCWAAREATFGRRDEGARRLRTASLTARCTIDSST